MLKRRLVARTSHADDDKTLVKKYLGDGITQASGGRVDITLERGD